MNLRFFLFPQESRIIGLVNIGVAFSIEASRFLLFSSCRIDIKRKGCYNGTSKVAHWLSHQTNPIKTGSAAATAY